MPATSLTDKSISIMRNRNDNSNPLVFTKADRIAIITILSIVAAVVAVCYIYPLAMSRTTLANRGNLDSLLMLQDAAVVASRNIDTDEASTLMPFDFNPNDMTDEQWQQMGLSERQIRSINNYMNSGGSFKIKADFAKLYCISEDEYAVLEPYIQLPDAYSKQGKTYDRSKGNKTYDPKKTSSPRRDNAKAFVVDLNVADSATLMTIPTMNKYMASRIVRYKNNLGNFVEVGQLLEVKGIDTASFQAMVPYLAMSQVDVEKINVNTFDFKSLLRHPYLNYDQVKSIVNHREKRGFIVDWEQLRTLLDDKGFVNPRLRYYVEF